MSVGRVKGVSFHITPCMFMWVGAHLFGKGDIFFRILAVRRLVVGEIKVEILKFQAIFGDHILEALYVVLIIVGNKAEILHGLVAQVRDLAQKLLKVFFVKLIERGPVTIFVGVPGPTGVPNFHNRSSLRFFGCCMVYRALARHFPWAAGAAGAIVF